MKNHTSAMKLTPTFEYEGTMLYKSSKSATGNCIAVGKQANGEILLGDTKHPELAPHKFNKQEWQAFAAAVQDGSFDEILNAS